MFAQAPILWGAQVHSVAQQPWCKQASATAWQQQVWFFFCSLCSAPGGALESLQEGASACCSWSSAPAAKTLAQPIFGSLKLAAWWSRARLPVCLWLQVGGATTAPRLTRPLAALRRLGDTRAAKCCPAAQEAVAELAPGALGCHMQSALWPHRRAAAGHAHWHACRTAAGPRDRPLGA